MCLSRLRSNLLLFLALSLLTFGCTSILTDHTQNLASASDVSSLLKDNRITPHTYDWWYFSPPESDVISACGNVQSYLNDPSVFCYSFENMDCDDFARLGASLLPLYLFQNNSAVATGVIVYHETGSSVMHAVTWIAYRRQNGELALLYWDFTNKKRVYILKREIRGGY